MYPEILVWVEYHLTDAGKALILIFDSICAWVMDYRPETSGQIF